jgi:hypothetical protein
MTARTRVMTLSAPTPRGVIVWAAIPGAAAQPEQALDEADGEDADQREAPAEPEPDRQRRDDYDPGERELRAEPDAKDEVGDGRKAELGGTLALAVARKDDGLRGHGALALHHPRRPCLFRRPKSCSLTPSRGSRSAREIRSPRRDAAASKQGREHTHDRLIGALDKEIQDRQRAGRLEAHLGAQRRLEAVVGALALESLDRVHDLGRSQP